MYDFHTHFIPQDVLTWLKDNQVKAKAKWEKKAKNKADFLFIDEKWGFELKPAFYDFELYSHEQQKAGISHSIISPIPQLFMYDFPQEITVEISEVYNHSLIQLVKTAPYRISALGTVPLTYPENAARVLQDAIHQGLRGVIIGPGLPGKMLSDEFFRPFFEEANRLGAIIFVHPLLSENPRLQKYMMPNLVGIPWETTVCASDILLSGLIDKYPNVKILFAHGGGFLPYQIGRLNKGFDMWDQVSSRLEAPPSEYLKRFWYDSVLWDKESLDFLTKTVGADRVVPGSDYPFDLSVWPPEITNKKGIHSLLAIKSVQS
ncbi:amidohydrolase family protein [Cytobacillus massiliigabonensis]|uniref:amidohydrolase family protein n=1 Tax=Cytobacillus massiliigabonensis TaxID=1871011 RepID=UPI000C82B645|nr:amidohydrolase family protein [Cytobacillus massiliigabonensis]